MLMSSPQVQEKSRATTAFFAGVLTATLKSDRARRIQFALGSLVFVLCFLEFPALIKVVDYGTLVGPSAGDIFLATNKGDPELLHIHPPHSHFSGAARGGNIAANFRIPISDMTLYRWDVQYDQNGFRNGQDLKSADLAVIGDSFVEDTVIPTEQLTTSLLTHLQDKVVANLGQYGYGPLEELAVLRRYALPLHPATVIWMFYEGNDLKDVIHYRKVTMAAHAPPTVWSTFWARSFTRNALAQLYVQSKRALKPSGVQRSGVIQRPNGERLKVYFLYTSAPLSEEELNAFDQTTHALKEAHTLCAAQGIRLIFVFIPTKFRAWHKSCQFTQESACRNWTVSDLPERMESAVKAISPEIGYLDLTPYLANALNKDVISYYPDDDHWSPDGHRIAAEVLNDYLRALESKMAH
jgi:acetyltransferase AlgX (SGNH hydrolase-like protein)